MELENARAAGFSDAAPQPDLMEALEQRHSVRQYLDKPIDAPLVAALADAVYACNREGGLHIQLVTNEPDAFAGGLAKYGKFTGVSNYIALAGKKAADLDERCGYYGEKLVLLAQQLGLRTCWVGLTFQKRKATFEVGDGERLVLVIALGYGATNGKTRKSKSFRDVNRTRGEIPTWYRRGVEAALLAPTAVNQQKFAFTFEPNAPQKPGVRIETTGFGFFSKVDLGIAKYHFEIGAQGATFQWI